MLLFCLQRLTKTTGVTSKTPVRVQPKKSYRTEEVSSDILLKNIDHNINVDFDIIEILIQWLLVISMDLHAMVCVI